jgi:nicotinate phosphoribosyltransferase
MLDDYNLTLLTDFYELTMANGYFQSDIGEREAVFDMFFRRIPDKGGYAIMAGVEQVVNYLDNLHFTEEDLEYLSTKAGFSPEFLDYLRHFEFKCDVWAVPEGTPIFPQDPIITVRGPVMQAQFVETMILLTINHQALIATKASRIVRAAQGRPVMEFGTRRAQGTAAATLGARASYIAGCVGTACTIADRDYGVPALGTMAHSWIQAFDNEYEAFKAFVKIYPHNASLLIDTYNALKSGLPNAIKVFKEMDPPNKSVRLDSGDIAYLTKEIRRILDENGLEDCKIIVSNSLDEYIIREVISEGAQIDSFGVGERLITAESEPIFGGVYKMSAIESNGELVPKMKVSENIEKLTNPGFKKLLRVFDKDNHKAIADIIALYDEEIPVEDGYEIFDPLATWKRKKLKNYYLEDIRVQLFDKGKLVYDLPTLDEIRDHCKEQLETLWGENKRFDNPQEFFVDLSPELWQMKYDMLVDLSDDGKYNMSADK